MDINLKNLQLQKSQAEQDISGFYLNASKQYFKEELFEVNKYYRIFSSDPIQKTCLQLIVVEYFYKGIPISYGYQVVHGNIHNNLTVSSRDEFDEKFFKARALFERLRTE